MSKSQQQPFLLPTFQAHRGYHLGGAKENTWEAISQAKARGATMVEVDVSLTKDLIPALLHDADLKRVFGHDVRLDAITAGELERYTGPSTLTSTLEEFPEMRFNVEIKIHPKAKSKALALAVGAALKAHSKRCLVSSFRPDALGLMAKSHPEITRGYLLAKNFPVGMIDILTRRIAKAQLLHLHHPLINEKQVKYFMARGVSTVAWTVNDSARAQHLFDLGVKSVITDSLI